MPLAEFDEMKDLQLLEFRRDMVTICKKAILLREEIGDPLYVFPPHVESTTALPENILHKLDEGKRTVHITRLGNYK